MHPRRSDDRQPSGDGRVTRPLADPRHARLLGVVAVVLAASVGVMGWWVVRGRSADARQSQVVDLPDAGWSSVRIAVVAALVTVAVVLPLAVANVVARRRSSGPS